MFVGRLGADPTPFLNEGVIGLLVAALGTFAAHPSVVRSLRAGWGRVGWFCTVGTFAMHPSVMGRGGPTLLV